MPDPPNPPKPLESPPDHFEDERPTCVHGGTVPGIPSLLDPSVGDEDENEEADNEVTKAFDDRSLRAYVASQPSKRAGGAGVANAGGSTETAIAHIEVLAGPSAGEIFAVRERETLIGRSSKAPIRIRDLTVSRAHAVLIFTDNHFRLRDHGGVNSVYVNGHRIVESVLRDEDIVVVGQTTLQFHLARAR
jgi:hypothetical protein